MSITFKHFDSAAALEDAVYQLLSDAFQASGQFAVMVAGGSTPLKAYNRLAKSDVRASSGAHLVFSDDRHVPSTSPDSNLGNCSPMIARLELDPDRVLHVNAELSLEDAADDFEEQLLHLKTDGIAIDLGLLGMGADGHTCSIFTPEAAAIDDRLAFAVPAEGGFDRVSVSRPVLMETKRIVFLVAGESKLEILRSFKANPLQHPAGLATQGHPWIEVWTDQAI